MMVYIMVVALERRGEGGEKKKEEKKKKKGRRIELYFGGTIVSKICLNHERDDTIVTRFKEEWEMKHIEGKSQDFLFGAMLRLQCLWDI